MANPLFPDISGQEYDPLWARQMAEQDIPRVPAQYQQAPDFNVGPLHLNGSGVDAASLAVLRAMKDMPQPTSGLGGLASGFVSGYAGARAAKAQARSAANAAEDKRVLGDDIERRKQASEYGRMLRSHQLQLAMKAKTESPMVDIPGVGKVPATSEIGRQYLTATGKVPIRDAVGSRNEDIRAQAASDAEQLLEGVMAGDLSPNPSDLFSSRDPEIRKQFNILAKQKGFNLLAAQRTHQGYKTFYNTLNGRLQLAVRQSVSNAQGGLDLLSDLNKQMASRIPRNSQFTVLNRAALAAAKQGAFGKEARDLAIQMDQQIGNLISELANVYQGGGVPTDEARKQAEANFYGKFAGERSLEKNIELAKKDVGIRANAILTTGPMTPNTPTGGYPVPQPPPAPGQAPPSVNDAPVPVAPAPPLGGLFGAIKSQVEQARGGKKK